MKAWLESLAPRERMLVLGAAFIVLLLMLYLLLWAPLRAAYVDRQDKVEDQRETVAWMREAARQYVGLKQARGPAAEGLGGQSLLALADSSARSSGLAAALKRVEPEGSNSVKVWMDAAAFDVLVGWLGDLNNRYGINAEMVSLERVPGVTGRVNARLTLQVPG